jgi:hypothetical protein
LFGKKYINAFFAISCTTIHQNGVEIIASAKGIVNLFAPPLTQLFSKILDNRFLFFLFDYVYCKCSIRATLGNATLGLRELLINNSAYRVIFSLKLHINFSTNMCDAIRG